LKKWLKQPTTERQEILKRLEITNFLFQNEHLRSDIQGVHLRTFPDLEKLYAKFYRVQAKLRHNAQLVDCVKVYNMIHTLESLCQYLDDNVMDENHSIRGEILDPLKGTLDEFSKLKSMLEECIDIGKAKQNDYIINPEFSPELKELNTEIGMIRQKMEALKQSVLADLGTSKRVDLVESNLHTFMFEVDKKEGDAGVRKSQNQYKIISIKNRIMSFTCSELKELVREYNELEDNYKAQQDELVQKVLEIASTYYPLLERVSIVVSQLDVLAAFAPVSANYSYVQPIICPEDQADQRIILVDSRHPLIEVQDPAQCISNNCDMRKG
jgi:DNA mismatch repair protein MSH2